MLSKMTLNLKKVWGIQVRFSLCFLLLTTWFDSQFECEWEYWWHCKGVWGLTVPVMREGLHEQMWDCWVVQWAGLVHHPYISCLWRPKFTCENEYDCPSFPFVCSVNAANILVVCSGEVQEWNSRRCCRPGMRCIDKVACGSPRLNSMECRSLDWRAWVRTMWGSGLV